MNILRPSPRQFYSRFKLKMTALPWLAFGLIVALQGGCFELEPEPINYGLEVAAGEVDLALNAPLEKRTPLSMQVGDFVAIEENQTVGTGKPLITSDVGLSVINRVVNPEDNTVSLTWLEETYRYSGGETQHQIREFTRTFAHSPLRHDFRYLALAAPLLSQLEFQVQALAPSRKVRPSEAIRRTYHDLQVSEEISDPPEAVKQDPTCGGLSPCQIRTFMISFSEVTWYNDQAPDKIQYAFRVSPDVPYFARVLNLCLSTSVPVEGQRYRVVQCKNVYQFKFGTAPS